MRERDLRNKPHRKHGKDIPRLLAAIAFFCSAPLLLPTLDALATTLHPWEPLVGPLVALDGTFFLRGMMLGVMFAALAMLFICLLKTAYGRLGIKLVFTAGVIYAAGMVLVLFSASIPDFPPALLEVISVPTGLALSLLCMAWMIQLDLHDYRYTLRALALLAAGATITEALVHLMSPLAGSILLCALIIIGTVGCVYGSMAGKSPRGTVTVPGSNWWDVFGHLDVSLMEEARDFGRPIQRALLMIVTPAAVLLLMVLGMDMYRTSTGDQPLMIVGGVLALLCCVPLLVMRTNRRTLNFAYRLYLPVLVAAIFVAGNFAPESYHQEVFTVGIYAFCTLYGIIMSATIISMAHRMPSLRLPAASLLLVAAGIICLLGNTVIDAGSLNIYKLQVLMVFLVLTAALFLSMSSGGFWSLVLDGLPAPSGDASTDAPPLEDRCQDIASLYGLTPREAEILQFLGRGHGSSYIAENLVVAESTVRSHVKSIYRKIGINSREELLELIDSSERTEDEDGASISRQDRADS